MKTIMKNLLIVLIFGTTIVSTTHAAHFSYYAGGFGVVCEVYAQDAYFFDGPYSSVQAGTEHIWVENEALALQASSLARNTVISGLRDNSVYIRMFSLTVAISLDSYGYAYGFGGASTQDDNTLGVFYKIDPNTGEELGDEVIVYWTGQVSIEPMGRIPRGDVFALLTGCADMDHLAITKGQLPPVTTTPEPAYEMWTMPNIDLHNQAHYGFEQVHKFEAKIGDIIGIFVTIGTGNTCSGYQSGTIISNLTMTFTVESVLRGDLDGDGDVDFKDFAKLADNWLAGIP